MNQQLCEKLAELENKMNNQMMHTVNEQEKVIYNMLSGLAKEIQQLLVYMEEISKEPSCKGIVFNYQQQCQEIIEETLEILEEIINIPFKVLIGKKIYEMIEDQMAELDDWIETINEELDNTSRHFPYIEAWDIGVFLENNE